MIVLVIYFSFAWVILVPIQALKLNSQTQAKLQMFSFNELIWFSTLSVGSALAVGFTVVYLVMFGPSYITGDFIGLPWLTMLPALVLVFWVGIKTNRTVMATLLARKDKNAE